MRLLLCGMLGLASFSAFAEGGCPPGQYSIGRQGVVGCAPIPGATQPAQAAKPTGRWETRWGAVAEDSAEVAPGGQLATGTAVSQKSKRAANALAISVCEEMGGRKCKVIVSYHDQCVAMADPMGDRMPGAISTTTTAETAELAKRMSLDRCQAIKGQRCEVFYSGCSLPEHEAF